MAANAATRAAIQASTTARRRLTTSAASRPSGEREADTGPPSIGRRESCDNNRCWRKTKHSAVALSTLCAEMAGDEGPGGTADQARLRRVVRAAPGVHPPDGADLRRAVGADGA